MNDRLALAVAVCALVPSIYGAALPPLSEVRAAHRNSSHAAAWNQATATAAGVVVAAAAASGSREVLILGGALAAVYASLYRAAVTHSPDSP